MPAQWKRSITIPSLRVNAKAPRMLRSLIVMTPQSCESLKGLSRVHTVSSIECWSRRISTIDAAPAEPRDHREVRLRLRGGDDHRVPLGKVCEVHLHRGALFVGLAELERFLVSLLEDLPVARARLRFVREHPATP